MYILIGFIVLVLAVVAIVTLLVLHYMHQGLALFHKMFSGDFTDEEVERLSQKNYRPRDEQRFGDDYFKRSAGPAGGQSWQQEQSGRQEQRRTKTAATTTPEGVTVIDERNAGRNRKIFQDNEGEYVDFSEA